MDELGYIMALSMIFPTASPQLEELLANGLDAEQIYAGLKSGSLKAPPAIARAAREVDFSELDNIRAYCENHSIKLITYTDSRYPAALRDISCPPILIYCKGDISVLDNTFCFAVVGARNATMVSENAAKAIAFEMAKEGAVIVSGLAVGTDTAAHEGALAAGGKTAAVLGCGIDVDYPKGSLDFKQRIVQNGLLISEYPPLAKAERQMFPIRNRIIAGLARGVLVIQASSKSGALSTARHALDQGKEVFVLPPADIFSSAYSGQCSLLMDGATPVYSVKTLLNSEIWDDK